MRIEKNINYGIIVIVFDCVFIYFCDSFSYVFSCEMVLFSLGENVCVCVFFKRNVNVLMQVSILNFRYGDFVRLSVLRYRGGGQEEFSCSTVSTFEKS